MELISIRCTRRPFYCCPLLSHSLLYSPSSVMPIDRPPSRVVLFGENMIAKLLYRPYPLANPSRRRPLALLW